VLRTRIEPSRSAGYVLLKFLTVFGAEAHRRPKFEDESQAVGSHRLVGGPLWHFIILHNMIKWKNF
jgi:hypothetical protein